MIYTVTKEMNRELLFIEGSDIAEENDYRFQMINGNEIYSILPFETRQVNGEKKLCVDITERISLKDYFNNKTIEKAEIMRLYEAIFVMLDEIARFLMDERDIVMNPQYIYKDLTTGEYAFLCIPGNNGKSMEEGIKGLIEYLISHLDTNNEKLVNTMYSIFDLYDNGSPNFSLVYRYFVENTKEEYSIEPVQSKEPETEKSERYHYIPTFREVLALGLCLSGFIIIGYSVCLSVIR